MDTKIAVRAAWSQFDRSSAVAGSLPTYLGGRYPCPAVDYLQRTECPANKSVSASV